MRVLKFIDKEDWKDARLKRITGTRKIMPKRGNAKLIGFYELIAERISEPTDGQNPMERGNELEPLAIERFEKETKKEVDQSLVIWTRNDNENIAISPDGMVIGEKSAVEVKCLSSAKHIQAFLTQEIPKDYSEQVLQYFIVNEKLEKLYFCFYDPRLIVKDFFYITVNRTEIQLNIDNYLEYQRKTLEEVSEIVNRLTF